MKIGILSDTHDRLDTIEKVFHIFLDEKVEQIIHCGDWVSPFTIEFFDEMNLFRFHGHEVVPFSRQAWIGLFIMLVLTKKD